MDYGWSQRMKTLLSEDVKSLQNVVSNAITLSKKERNNNLSLLLALALFWL